MKTLIFIIMLALFIPLIVSGEEAKTFIAAGNPWPPFVDPQNPRGGLSIEIIRAALKTQGYQLQYKNVPWARAENGVKNGIYDILPDVWFTTDREKEMMFSKPYTKNTIRFIALKDDLFEYDDIDSLQGKIIGTIRGYSYNEDFIKATHFKKEGVTDFIHNIEKLLSKRIDLTLEDEIVAKYRITQENPKLFERLRFSRKPFTHQSLYIASGYKNPRHKEIIEAFNRGLEIIKANGSLANIINSYFVKK